MKARAVPKTVLLILIIANIAVIWSLSIFSVEDSGAQSGRLMKFLISCFPILDTVAPELLHTIIRKLAHFCEFGLLGVLSSSFTYVSVDGDTLDHIGGYAVAALSCLFVASTDEMIQAFTDRGNSPIDIMIDFSGALTGIIGMAVIFALWKLIINKNKA